jgi:TIR domain-containing protein
LTPFSRLTKLARIRANGRIVLAIAVTCANCGVRLRFKSEHAGKSVKCRACEQPLIVQGQTVPDHDVFISYSSKDANIANAVCAAMEAKRIRCWMAPRDVLAGKPWAGAILDAISDARVMVLVYSSSANSSPQVIREVDRAVTRNVIIVPFRIEAAAMSKEMEYYIASAHWLDAMNGPLEQHVAKLVDTVKRLLNDKPTGGESVPAPHADASAAARSRSGGWLALIVVLALLIGAGAWLIAHRQGAGEAPIVSVPGPAEPQRVDLLSFVDVAKDTVRGSWALAPHRLTAGTVGSPHLEFAYVPPDEYDYVVKFNCAREPVRHVFLIVAENGHQFIWHLGLNDNKLAGFALVGGKKVPENPTARSGQQWVMPGEHVSMVKVRRDGVEGYLDDQLVSSLKTDYTDVGIGELFRQRRNDTLGLSIGQAITVRAVEVNEISGPGKRLR